MRRSTTAAILVWSAVSLVVNTTAHADVALQSFLEQALAWLRARDHDPAIAALIQIDGKVEAEAAVGSRAVGHLASVTVDDRWHIGSDTKAFTATLIGTLVDRHEMTFEDSLGASFPALADIMNPGYRHVTVRQLLSHTAGLPPLKDPETEFPAALAAVKSVDGVSAQRAALVRYYLTKPPGSAAGKFQYSNLGYIIAGAIAEAHTGKTWEASLRERVFAPLGIENVSFGPPGHSGKYDQPSGHVETSGGLAPLDTTSPDSGNPAWIGPGAPLALASGIGCCLRKTNWTELSVVGSSYGNPPTEYCKRLSSMVSRWGGEFGSGQTVLRCFSPTRAVMAAGMRRSVSIQNGTPSF